MERLQHRFNTFYDLKTPAAKLFNDAWWNAEEYYNEDYQMPEGRITREALYPYMIGILYSKINSLCDEKSIDTTS
jgi:hypothetical protein